MIVRTQIECKIGRKITEDIIFHDTNGREISEVNKWALVFSDENGLITMCAIPPTNGDRVDIFLSIWNDNCYKNEYLYDYTGNLKKLRGEKIIISIIAGEVQLEYKQ